MDCKYCKHEVEMVRGKWWHIRVINHYGGGFSKNCHSMDKYETGFCQCKLPEPYVLKQEIEK